MFAMTNSVDGCSILPVTLFVRTSLLVDTTRISSVRRSIPTMGAARVTHQTAFMGFNHDFSLRLSHEVFSTRGYFRKIAGFEIKVFPLLGEMPKAIQPHLHVCQLYRRQLGPNVWFSLMTKSLDPITVTTFVLTTQWKASDRPQVELPAIPRCQKRRHRLTQPQFTIMPRHRQ